MEIALKPTKRKKSVFKLPIFTNQLVMMPIVPGNSDKMLSFLNRSGDDLKQFMFWPHQAKTAKDADSLLEKYYYEFKREEALHLVMFRKDDPLKEIQGVASLLNINWDEKIAEIMFCVDGLDKDEAHMIEAGNALTRYGLEFLGLEKLFLQVHETNRKVLNVAKALGYSLLFSGRGLSVRPFASELEMGFLYLRTDTAGLSADNACW